MSQITANSGQGIASGRSTPVAAPGRKFVAPTASIVKKINFRVVLLAAIAFLFVGYPFFFWARDMFDGGIVNHGNYADVNLKAMSDFDLDQMNGQITDVPLRFRQLEGKRVAMLGQMWAPNYAGDGSLKYFMLCYNRAKCCFAGPPLAQHFVDSYVKPGATAYYDDGMVRVWGTLHVRFRRDPTTGVIKAIYMCEVDRVDDL
ncbi:MAG TPA: hypothetical protein VL992_06325 [Tepidisphaeraceae bacterium]|nr:hypothetical protein [Tepidisphaeraceae bacterium]